MAGKLLSLLSTGALEASWNDGWLFRRGQGQWVNVETPHDWAIDELPPREEDKATPVVAVRN
eukprot:scaffold182158_cov23-Tisochrysis_lutea.AAC.1